MSRFDRMLATILTKRNLIAEDQRETLIAECEQTNQPLPAVLLRKRICREPALIAAVADELNCHPILLEHVTPSPEALQLLTGEQCLKNEVLPISRLGNTLTLAVVNPFDEPRLDQIRSATGCEVIPVLSTAPSLRRKLKACFPELPIVVEEIPQDPVQPAATDPESAQASWLNLAEELEKEAAKPPEPLAPVAQASEMPQTPASEPAPAPSAVPTEQAAESAPSVEEIQLDLDAVRRPPVDEEPPAPPAAAALSAPPVPEAGSPAQESPAAQPPAQEDARVEVEEEIVIQEEAVEPPASAPSVPAEEMPQKAEVEVRSEEVIVTEESVPFTLPEQPGEPPAVASPTVPAQAGSVRPWSDLLAAAETHAGRVSWSRVAEADVPPSDEELQGVDAQALKVARAFLLEAFEQGYEELVFESEADGLHVLERTARVLRPLTVAPRDLQAALLGRLKWMAGLKAGERHAQTGSFQAGSRGREFVCRLHVLPTILGERLQIELVPLEVFTGGMERLGITGSGAEDYRWAVSSPAGLVLLAAPPGHGREPTLRTLLSLSRPHGEQAIALENPVLVRMPGVTQVAVGRSAGLGTAEALRTALRRVPDRLMVTDLRDAETARWTIQAAASGCLVLAGMDAPDVFCALARLADCGLPPFTLASALRLAASQRSLRRLCVNCRQPVTDGRDRLLAAGCTESELADATLFRAVGCSECRHGYRGRLHVYETLRISGDLRQMVRSGVPVGEWRNKTLAWGFLTLRRTALRLALHGQTSLEEVLVSTPEDV